MKLRKLILLAADVILLAVCIVQCSVTGKSTVKYYDLSETPDELVIQLPEMTYSIVKENSKWFVGNKKYPANDGTVESLVNKISSVKALNKVGKATLEANLTRYELNEGQKVVVTAKADGKVLRTLNIGKDSTGTQGYVCFDDSSDIYLVASNLKFAFNKNPDEFRSKIVFDFEKGSVKSVEKIPVSSEDKGWSMNSKSFGENVSWTFSGIDLELDEGKVTDWTNAISSLINSKWFSEDYVIPAEMISKLKIGTGKDSVILEIYENYDEAEDKSTYYGKCSNNSCPFEIAEYSVSKFLKEPEDFTK